MSKTVVTMWLCVVGMVLGASVTGWGAPMGTAFVYQGSLKDGDSPANGSYDFKFYLYDASVGGSLLGAETKNGVVLLDGYFDVELDFGSSPFHGEARWLEIEVKPTVEVTYTTLSPRQELKPTPYALYATSGGGWVDDGAVVRLETSDDKVGIGTVSPEVNLHVRGSGHDQIKLESTPSWGTATVLLKTSGGMYDYLKLEKGGPSASGSTAGGIPLANLSRLSSGAHAGPLMLQVTTNNPMHFVTDNEERMRITSDGNVGIGTTSPTSELEVAGTIHSTSRGFKFPDGTTQTTAAGLGLLGATVLNVDCTSLGSFSTTYAKILDIGLFTKIDADSTMEITFNGRIAVTGSLSGTGANFELRVDDAATTNGRARASFKASEVGSDGVPVSITGIFTGLSSGSHTVSIWVRAFNGTGTNAVLDPGCWSADHVVIKELL